MIVVTYFVFSQYRSLPNWHVLNWTNRQYVVDGFILDIYVCL